MDIVFYLVCLIRSHTEQGFHLKEIGAGPSVLEDFNVPEKWEKFRRNIICVFGTIDQQVI